MCEIAILKPSMYHADRMTTVAMTLYESMRSSLGIVAVYDEGGKFRYEVYRDIDPEREEVLSFIDEHEEGPARMIFHGRLATHGAVTDQHAHPLEIDCPECDVDYVVHNGVISRHLNIRQRQMDRGHEFSTEVDSEVIAHEFGRVPADWDEEMPDHFDWEPAYILLNEDNILISSNHYHLAPDGTMARARRNFGPGSGRRDVPGVILTPASEE